MEVGWWALLVSLGSLGLSGATFWRNRTPTPRWEAGVKVDISSDGKYRVTGAVENRGRGAALDVHFKAGEGIMGLFSQQSTEQLDYGKKLDITLLYPLDTSGTGKFVLTWYQEPDVHRKRTKVLKYKLKPHVSDPALVDADVPTQD